MKHMQFKAAQFLLNSVQTTSYNRIDEDEQVHNIPSMESESFEEERT